MSQFLSHSPAETEDFGFRLAQQLKGGEVIAMYGGMGMMPSMNDETLVLRNGNGENSLYKRFGTRIGDRIWYIQPYLCFGT